MSAAFAAKSWCRDDQICPDLPLIDRYLARQIAVPLLGSLILAAMLLVLDKMLRLFQYVVDAGGPVSVVWRMLANLLPEYLSLGIPIGLMLGILLAFRKLALSSELDALRGIGIGYGRLLRIPYAYAIPLRSSTCSSSAISSRIPHYRYEGLRFDLKSGALGAAIKVGEFNQLGHKLTLRIDRSENDGTQLYGIFVQTDEQIGHDRRRDRRTRPVPVDRRSRHHPLPADQGPAHPGFAQVRNAAHSCLRQLRSADQPAGDRPLPPPRRHPRPTSSTSHELFRLGYGDDATSVHQQLEAQAAFNSRLVEVVMMLMLPLLAVALAVPPKRSSSSLGIFLRS